MVGEDPEIPPRPEGLTYIELEPEPEDPERQEPEEPEEDDQGHEQKAGVEAHQDEAFRQDP